MRSSRAERSCSINPCSTGESVPIEAGAGRQAYAGSLVRRGEAVAEVTATGAHTKFGKTAELVLSAHVVSSQQKAVMRVVGNLAAFNGVFIVGLTVYAALLKMPIAEIVPLILTAVLASIPVALPATFTLAAALGARNLAKLGVLPTRLSAVDEAATMDVLCADKTGTLTQNALSVAQIRPMPNFDEAHVLALAALASSEGGQDPVDEAIRSAALGKDAADTPKLTAFTPFDPATKMSEASAVDSGGATQRVVKGAYAVVIALAETSPTAEAIAKELEGQGFRVLAVAAGAPEAMKLIGLIALSDPPRADSAALVKELQRVGRAHGDGDGRRAGDGRHRRAVGRARRRCLSARAHPRRGPARRLRRLRRRPAGGQVQARQGLSKRRTHRRHVRRRRQRCAGVAPGADRNCRFHGDRGRQSGRRHGAHRTRPGRHCRLGQARSRHFSANPDVHAQRPSTRRSCRCSSSRSGSS